MAPWEVILVAFALLTLVVVALALWQTRVASRRLEDALARLSQSGVSAADVSALRLAVDNRLDNFAQIFTNTSQAINAQLAAAGETIASVQQGLGRVHETSASVMELARDVNRLEELLRPPKTRGGIGEILLENVLSQVLPAEHYERQYPLAGCKVDFAVRIGNKVVPIDAKFPLESYERLAGAGDDEKKAARRDFAKAVRDKVDEIAARYIRPDLGTFDFALMYIPAESIYYEAAIAEGNLYDYAAAKRVFPVSPATTYVYLATVALGLQGMALEGRAAAVVATLRRLRDELEKFNELFRVTGKHLRDAANKYDEAARQLAAFDDGLSRAGRLTDGDKTTPPDETEDLFG